ncbi:hypothetical protein JZO70_13735 [Enterococcus sp. 669A]|uniref:DUF7601 domain-containing protein n=1 Tax=Candidatus Enterococcus moelleringii TaxID=2815325 RepID=A0ABS3LDW5_9ENTE|nr:hypothetical protein [Enterococcus sp. 669A]MBO1307233.1 hypothetical protein [Enterococcus sp. 669A]
MRRMMRQLAKGVGVFGLMVVAMVAFAGTAFAANPPIGLIPGEDPGTPAAPAEPKITKRVRVAEGLNVPANTYKFTLTREIIEDSETNEMSPIVNNPIEINMSASAPGTVKDADGYVYKEATSDNVLKDITFPHAGIYSYLVREGTGSNPINEGTMTYSSESYRMRVYVDNEPSTSNVYVKYVTFHLVTRVNGITTETKADPVFTNTYTKKTTFEIKKMVAGDYADKKKDFTYTLTLSKVPGVSGNQSYIAQYYLANGTKGRQGQFTVDRPVTFTLKHGESIVFEDNIEVGTKYKLEENPYANYKAEVVVSNADGEIGTEVGADKNTAVTIGDPIASNTNLQAPILLTEKSASATNKAEWTNTYAEPPTPTGIFLNNLPFILMIVIAISGFTGYIVMKRRSRRTE